MIVTRGDISRLPPLEEDVVVTVGNFDGVHRGHRALIETLHAKARHKRAKSALLSFAPHPAEVLQPDSFPGRLSSSQGLESEIAGLGVGHLVVQDFSETFSQVSREDFLRQYLMPFFHPAGLLIGYDFQFGRHGRGDFSFARDALPDLDVWQSQPFSLGSSVVSSSRIRQSLLAGDVAEAQLCLGRPYQISGVVESGRAIGRTLGFPTANITQPEVLVPKDGVYVGYATVEGRRWPGLINIGYRPTLSGKKRRSYECHLLGFSGTLYGLTLSFEFAQRIRAEKKFDNVDMLKDQITLDINRAKEILKL